MTASADGEKAKSPYLDTEEAVANIAELGYDGIETPLKMIYSVGKEK